MIANFFLFCFSTLLCVRGETRYHHRTILLLAWSCLITVLYSSSTLLLCVRGKEAIILEQSYCSFLELSYCNLNTVLFCSSALVLCEIGYYLRTILLLSQKCLIAILSPSHFALLYLSTVKLAIILEQSYYCLTTVLLQS